MKEERGEAGKPGQYGRHYSEGRFWRKVGSLPRSAGRAALEKALTLYVILTDRGTPMWARVLVIGALGYFICPLDAIPDAVPGAGYADDAAVMSVLLSQLGRFVTAPMRERVLRLMPGMMRRKSNQRKGKTNEQNESD